MGLGKSIIALTIGGTGAAVLTAALAGLGYKLYLETEKKKASKKKAA